MEALRESRTLTAREQATFEHGAVGVLAEIHADLDRAVAEAYGWPVGTDDEAAVERLAALNAERAVEEARGHMRYVRPEFQNPGTGTQAALDIAAAISTVNKTAEKQPWPASMSERVVAVRQAVTRFARPVKASEVGARFTRARVTDVADVLGALDALGLVQHAADGTYSA